MGILEKAIYSNVLLTTAPGAGGDKISATVNSFTVWLTGLGTSLFTLALTIIGILLMFASFSPQAKSKMWVAFFSCCGGAAVFFLAFVISGSFEAIFKQS